MSPAAALANDFHISTPSEREIVMTRTFNAPRHLVFDAWTNCKHLPHWMTGPEGWTMPKCEVDLRAGGAWCFGWQNSDGRYFEIGGVYREVAVPERLVQTERMGDMPESTTTLVFEERDGQTLVTQTSVYPSQAIRDMVLKTGMAKGVDASFKRLEQYLAGL